MFIFKEIEINEKMRCFIAIDLPGKVKKDMHRISKKVETAPFVKGNFVNKQNLHLTLKFLGELTSSQIEDVKNNLSDITLGKFECYTGKVGAFPAREYVKTLWIGLDGDGVMHLKGLIDNKLNSLGVKPDNKEFNSHITLGRVKGIKDKDKFFELFDKLEMKKTKFPVEKFYLIKSELTREGPKYKVLEEFELF